MSKKKFVLYLLPPAAGRLESLQAVLSGQPDPRRYLFYGLDFFKSRGVEVRHNLKPFGTVIHHLAWMNQRLFAAAGAPCGDLSWILPAWGELLLCSAVVAFSDRIILALCQLRKMGLVPRRPTMCIPMGLPEKLASCENRRLLSMTIDELRRLDCIVPLSMPECECLAAEYGLENVRFTATGVDADYFVPLELEPDVDVISIGADPFRDFPTLFAAARLLPDRNFLVVVSRAHADTFMDVPANVRVRVDVPMTELKEILASSRIVALPVRDNTYSGGTTVMLQAMAMGKPVVANRVGANVVGYGFASGVNCLFVEPGDAGKLATILAETLRDSEYLRNIGSGARLHVERELSLERFHGRLYAMVMDMIGHAGRMA